MLWDCVAVPKWAQQENRSVQLHHDLKRYTTAVLHTAVPGTLRYTVRVQKY